MPPRSVICQLCGGKFFASSLAHHQKVCQKKVGKQMHECPYCHAGVPLLEMDAHVTRCPAARSAGAKPTGASAALARRLDNHARGVPQVGEERVGGGGGMDEIPEFADGEDVRIACQICGRKFNMDRVGKHQAICEKLSTKKPRKQLQTQRAYAEGGAVVATAKHMNKPNPKPIQTKWREESESWREACKAGREHPLPPWGQSSPQRGGRSGPPAPRRGGPGATSPGPRKPPAPVQRRSPPPRSMQASAQSPVQGRPAPASPQARPAPASPQARPAPASLPAAPKDAPSDGFAALVVKQQFRLLDQNGDGRLDPQELRVLLKSGDADMTDREIAALFDNIDKDHDGRIDFGEFVDYVFSEQGAEPMGPPMARGRPVPQAGGGGSSPLGSRGLGTARLPAVGRATGPSARVPRGRAY